MRYNVYVDGFNLYYGALRGQPYRWLDIRRFARGLLRSGDEAPASATSPPRCVRPAAIPARRNGRPPT